MPSGIGFHLWYYADMPARTKPTSIKRSTSKFVIGTERFSKISAVEGIKLTPAMKKRAASFDELGLTAAERRREIIKIYKA